MMKPSHWRYCGLESFSRYVVTEVGRVQLEVPASAGVLTLEVMREQSSKVEILVAHIDGPHTCPQSPLLRGDYRH